VSDMVTIPRDVLGRLQWVGEIGYKECVFCDGNPVVGHKEACPIGIALKRPEPKPEVIEPEPVQYEIEFKGDKYRTVFAIAAGSCDGCDLKADCNLISRECLASENVDRKNRVWEKVTQ
jgi:hypothetical protein